jgi:uncharacterized membrane protein
MESHRLRNLILIPWLSLPITLASYLLLWTHLPSEIAVHFSFSGGPVTSMSRSQSLLFDLITLLLILTVGSLMPSKRKTNRVRVLVGFYFGISAVTIISLSLLLYNI